MKGSALLLRLITLCILWGWLSLNCFARFNHLDADRIDQEELLGVEYYNDIISYEHPIHWERKWRHSDVGYRVSAGSFNDKRFYYKEDIKLASPSDKKVVVSFNQERREDLLEESIYREAKLQFKQLLPLRLSVFGDGDSYKKWGDVGVGLGFEWAKNRYLEAYYWSVDHYYESKEGIKSDLYLKASKTHGLRFFFDHLGPFSFEARYEKDSPLIWHRESRYYLYKYARSYWLASLNYDSKDIWEVTLGLKRDLKQEAKLWNVTKFTDNREELSYSKDLDRDVKHYELSLLLHLGEREDLKFSIQKIVRAADYSYFRGSEVLDYQIDEEQSYDTVRNEGMFYTTWNIPVDPDQRTQLGLHCNQVSIDNIQKPEESLEVKAQFAWEWVVSANGSVMLNSSWDIDQIARDVKDNPWGGGDIQLFLAF